MRSSGNFCQVISVCCINLYLADVRAMRGAFVFLPLFLPKRSGRLLHVPAITKGYYMLLQSTIVMTITDITSVHPFSKYMFNLLLNFKGSLVKKMSGSLVLKCKVH